MFNFIFFLFFTPFLRASIEYQSKKAEIVSASYPQSIIEYASTQTLDDSPGISYTSGWLHFGRVVSLNSAFDVVRFKFGCRQNMFYNDKLRYYTIFKRQLGTSEDWLVVWTKGMNNTSCDMNHRQIELDNDLFSIGMEYLPTEFLVRGDYYVNYRGNCGIMGEYRYYSTTWDSPQTISNDDYNDRYVMDSDVCRSFYLDFLVFECEEDGYYGYKCSYLCEPGRMCPNGNASDCEAGTYQNEEGKESCKLCPVGTYQNETGKTGCINCEVGTYQDEEGQTTCKTCMDGYVLISGKCIQKWKCFNYLYDDPMVCWGRGVCGMDGICYSCEDSFGDNCEQRKINNDDKIEVTGCTERYNENDKKEIDCGSDFSGLKTILTEVKEAGSFNFTFKFKFNEDQNNNDDGNIFISLLEETKELDDSNKRSIDFKNKTILTLIKELTVQGFGFEEHFVEVNYSSVFVNRLNISQLSKENTTGFSLWDFGTVEINEIAEEVGKTVGVTVNVLSILLGVFVLFDVIICCVLIGCVFIIVVGLFVGFVKISFTGKSMVVDKDYRKELAKEIEKEFKRKQKLRKKNKYVENRIMY